MTLSPDVNVLVFAAFPGFPHHGRAMQVLEQARRSPLGLAVQSTVVSGFMRIATNGRLIEGAMTPDQALEFIDAVVSGPRAAIAHPGDQHWRIFSRLVSEYGFHRSDIADAWLAASAIEVNATWASFDRGFARFEGLEWMDPSK